MTEAEAKTKWCPHARVVAGVLDNGRMHLMSSVPAHNRVQEPGQAKEATTHAAHTCLASGCMAWRWNPGKMSLQGFREQHFVASDEGYCGLSGSPQ